jgi:hypothetical protein
MRRCLMGMAVGATLAIAASASAGASWDITGARVDTDGLGNLVDVTGSTGGALTIGARLASGWDAAYGSGSSVQAMSAANIAAVSGLGMPLADNTLTYFGFYAGSDGYFGVAFKNTTGSTITFDATFSRTNQALEGVQVAGSSTLGNYSAGSSGGNGTWSGLMTVAAGDTFYAVVAGFAGNVPMSIALSGVVDFGGTSRAVQYLSHDVYNPGTYTVAGSANGFTSNMQFAMFNIPVPAPVLLAAAGLVGAAAVRRRVLK